MLAMCKPLLPDQPARCAAHGFTLIELLVTLVVLGIITAVAMPAFFDSIRKGRRSDAVAALAAVQQTQERWRADHTTYAGALTDLTMGSSSPAGYYTVTINAADASGYTLTASAVGGKSQDKDESCKSMRVVLAAGNLSYSAKCGACDSFSSSDSQRCWNR